MTSVLITIITTVLTIIVILLFQSEGSHLFEIEELPTTTLSVIKDFIVPISSSFGGALLGAIGAYKLALRKEHKDTKEDELALLTSTFFVLKSQLNDLVAIKKNIIMPNQTKPTRMIDIPISVSVISIEQRVPEKAFSVLTKYKRPSVAEAIHIAERRYLNQKTIHSKRNDLITSYYEYIEHEGVVIFEKLNLHKSCKIFGINNMCQLYSITESFITFTDDAIHSLLTAMKDLQEAIEIEFSSKYYVKVKFEVPKEHQHYLEPVVSPEIASVEELYTLLSKVGFEEKMYHPTSYKLI
ncbi:hypothetical protein [Photobacterium leiognathi]|uniref:hypothetical protein n=1 Tax=Photobacterium leiognathi TaxID=553611 RepID=UPI0029810FFB|nr:hypothetical protein [Photobacterium leiognathi]